MFEELFKGELPIVLLDREVLALGYFQCCQWHQSPYSLRQSPEALLVYCIVFVVFVTQERFVCSSSPRYRRRKDREQPNP